MLVNLLTKPFVVCTQVKCEWGLTDQQESLLTVWVFIGLLIGAYVWGAAADIAGRKVALLCATVGGILTSSLAAIMPNIGVSVCQIVGAVGWV